MHKIYSLLFHYIVGDFSFSIHERMRQRSIMLQEILTDLIIYTICI